MKIRNGFVSNSSSSSFLILAVDVDASLLNIIYNSECENANEEYGYIEEHGLMILYPEFKKYESMENNDVKYKLVNSNFIGLELNENLLNKKTLKELKQELIEKFKREFRITLSEKDISLQYGEYQT